MTPLSSRLLFVLAALLLALWVTSPLSSSPPARSPVRAAAPAPMPELDAMLVEVDRLEARLTRPIRPTPSDRDLFRFAADQRASFVQPSVPPPTAAMPNVATTVDWPLLVAVTTSGTGAAPVHGVALQDASGLLHVLHVGDTLGDVTVTATSDDGVTLTHASGHSTTLRLR